MKTLNHEYYVSFEVAKLLKEAGFDWKCKYAYIITPDGDMPTGEEGMFTEYVENVNWLVSAPTLEVAQKWLREVKGILVFCTAYRENLQNPFDKWEWDLILVIGGRIAHDSNCNTYEESQESAIKKALEIILEKGE